MSRKLIPLLLLVAILIAPNTASASLIIGQYTKNAVQTSSGRYVFQTYGNALTGRPESVTVRIKNTGGSTATQSIDVSIAKFGTGGYTGFLGSCELNSGTLSVPAGAEVDVTVVDFYTNCGSLVDFTPGNYYATRIDTHSAYRVVGSSANTYADGYAGEGGTLNPALVDDGTMTGISDIYFVIDTSNIPAPPTPPAISDYNEVYDYIYDPVLNNSVGTSTVGASFSIGQPDWIDAFGVELRGPTGNVLWNATSTESLPGIYDVSVDYYFNSSGAYLLQAYFIQDGNRIDNPVAVYIVVNAPEYTFDPVTGDLVPIASTTIATSTLTNFKVDCPDDALVGSLCKLAVGLFIPKGTSIQGIQVSFNGLMSKAPFSFFTQSKTVLDAFRVGTASSGGTFSLVLYGQTVPIVSSTTASSVGLNTDTINFFKLIMTVGLWLMLAWYLYWRIASIFGV